VAAETAAKLSHGLGRREDAADAVTPQYHNTLPSGVGLQVPPPRTNGHANGHAAAMPLPHVHLALT
jgi:hypothetical protein